MSGTNQILIDADVNPPSENIQAIQKVCYKYNFVLSNFVHRLKDVLKHYKHYVLEAESSSIFRQEVPNLLCIIGTH
jgi:hypothetical protein